MLNPGAGQTRVRLIPAGGSIRGGDSILAGPCGDDFPQFGDVRGPDAAATTHDKGPILQPLPGEAAIGLHVQVFPQLPETLHFPRFLQGLKAIGVGTHRKTGRFPQGRQGARDALRGGAIQKHGLNLYSVKPGHGPVLLGAEIRAKLPILCL